MTINSLQSTYTGAIVPGLICDWSASQGEHLIVTYQVQAVTRELPAQWAEAVVNIVRDWPAGKPYLAIHDLSQRGASITFGALLNYEYDNLGITQEGKHHLDGVIASRPDFQARVALIFSERYSGNIGELFSRIKHKRSQDISTIQYKPFVDTKSSLVWLTSD